MSSSIRSLKAPSWVSEFRAFIMRSVVNEISSLKPMSPLTSTHKNAKATCAARTVDIAPAPQQGSR